MLEKEVLLKNNGTSGTDVETGVQGLWPKLMPSEHQANELERLKKNNPCVHNEN